MKVQTNTNVSHPALLKLKAAVRERDPEAEIVLFGSRARGDAKADSDWDVLVATSLADDGAFKDKIFNISYDYTLNYIMVLSIFYFDLTRWKRGDSPSPFYDNIREEGIVL